MYNFLMMRLYVVSLLFVCVSISHCTNIINSNISTKNPLTITCSVKDSNAVVSWEYTTDLKSKNATILTAQTASINLTSIDEAGLYSCMVNNTVVENITVAYFVEPQMQNARQSITFNDGDVNRKLTCTSSGSYPSVEFIWKMRREDEDVFQEIDVANFSSFNITHYAESSVLLFHNLTYDMQAYYQCFAMNTAGNGTAEVLIRVKDKLAALWPFLGIVGEVSLLIVIIFVYEKKSKKQGDVSTRDVTGDADKPLNLDAGDEEEKKVRNRLPNNNHKK